jgi:hypothetical protein
MTRRPARCCRRPAPHSRASAVKAGPYRPTRTAVPRSGSGPSRRPGKNPTGCRPCPERAGSPSGDCMDRWIPGSIRAGAWVNWFRLNEMARAGRRSSECLSGRCGTVEKAVGRGSNQKATLGVAFLFDWWRRREFELRRPAACSPRLRFAPATRALRARLQLSAADQQKRGHLTATPFSLIGGGGDNHIAL